MTTVNAPTDSTERWTVVPDEKTITDTVVALEEHGFSVEVVDDLAAARAATLARIPHGSSVMTNTSVTLDETGIAAEINEVARTSRCARPCSRWTSRLRPRR
jgi:hypothetical protein